MEQKDIIDFLKEYTDNLRSETLSYLDSVREEVLGYVETLKGPQGHTGVGLPGRSGKDADEEKIIRKILDAIPKPKNLNEKEIIGKILAAIPRPSDGRDGADITVVTSEVLFEKLKPELDKYLDKVRPRILGEARRLGGGGGGGGGTMEKITITGTVNGTNDVFTLSKTYTFLALYWNGQLQEETTHYTKSGTTITFTAGNIPTAGTLHGFGQPS